jgi:predicted acyl esterase
MTNIQSSGIGPGERRLNGPQTTGRDYRNLSQPTHAMAHDDDVAIPMRDGVTLLADVHRPAEPGRYPVLVAASPYPRVGRPAIMVGWQCRHDRYQLFLRDLSVSGRARE